MLSLLFAFFHLADVHEPSAGSTPHLTHIHDMTHGDNFVHYCVVFVATESRDSRTNAVKSLLLYTFQSM